MRIHRSTAVDKIDPAVADLLRRGGPAPATASARRAGTDADAHANAHADAHARLVLPLLGGGLEGVHRLLRALTDVATVDERLGKLYNHGSNSGRQNQQLRCQNKQRRC